MERIQSKSKKLCGTLEKQYKLESENLAVLRMNEQQLIKAYHVASLPHLKNIEVIYFPDACSCIHQTIVKLKEIFIIKTIHVYPCSNFF